MTNSLSKSRKALIALYFIIIVLLVTVTALYYHRIDGVAYDQLEQEMIYLAASESDRMTSLLSKFDSMMTILGRELINNDPNLTDLKNIKIVISQIVTDNHSLAAIGVADSTGQLLVVSSVALGTPLPHFDNISPIDESFSISPATDSMIGRTYFVSFLDNGDGQWVIPIRLDIISVDGDLTIAFGLRLQNDSQIPSHYLIGKEVYVFRSDGYLQYTNNHMLSNRNLYNKEFDVSGINNITNILSPIVSPVTKQDVLGLTAQNKYHGFKLLITVSADTLQKMAEGDIWLLILLFIMSIFVLTIIFFIVFRIIDRYEKELLKQANHCSLTGLPNRNSLHNELAVRLSNAKQNNTEVAVFFIDLDDFKQVNDTYNHFVGDQLLVAVANRLTGALRKNDFVARLGGDEFVVITSNIDNRRRSIINVDLIADCIHKATTDKIAIDDLELFSNSSVGIAIYPKDAKTTTELLRKADLAMYQAKHDGKNQTVKYTAEIETATLLDFEMQSALKDALANDEFYLVYQPQVCTKTKKIVGVEALLRWSNPEFTNTGPDIFIPLLEKMKLMNKVGCFVMKQALSDFSLLKNRTSRLESVESDDFHISVNMAAMQFQDENLVTEIKKTLALNNLRPEELEIELTESALLVAESEHEFIHELAMMGIGIAIDDFGTGYSSLTRLSALPISNIKIDKTFVDLIGADYKAESLIGTIMALGYKLNTTIVAEGVEHIEQCEFLKDRHENIVIQGYLFSKPLGINDLIAQIDTISRQCRV